MYKYCIFDLYGTLVDIHTDEEQLKLWEKLALFYGYYGARYTPLELKETYQRLTQQTSREHISGGFHRNIGHEAFPELQIEDVFLKLFKEKNVEADMTLAVHGGQFFRVLSTEYVRLYDGAAQMLSTLKEHGKTLILLSNAQRIFTEYEMKSLGIWDIFHHIFISSDYGIKKPDLDFYETMLTQCHVVRDEAIMVGNDGICDIRGAKAAGLATLYIRSNLSPKEDLPDADHVVDTADMAKVGKILLKGGDK